MSDFKKITEQELKEGTKLFEGFWLRPKQYVNKTVPLRLRINKKWGGWKIKDELFHTQIGVGNRLDGGRRRVKKYLWSFFRTAPAGQVRL